MIRFLRKLWGDRRGNVLIIAGMLLPMLVGAAGLATDTIMWAMWKRELQRAADSAAFAGVYARIQEDGAATAEDEINADLLKHNTTGVPLLAGYPVIEYPAVQKNAVKVTLAIQRKLGFSSLFLSTPPIIKTSAVAAQVHAFKYCVMGLTPTGSALLIGGSAIVDLGCAAYSNSTDPLYAVNVMGDKHWFAATAVVSAGEIDGTINGTDPINLLEWRDPSPDPYAGLDMSIPDELTCMSLDKHIVSQTGSSSTGDLQVVLEPGCYNDFKTDNGTYTLQSGTYYLNNTDLRIQGSTSVVGDGVTIVLTGTKPGSVANNGTSSFELTAPTDLMNPFEGLVLVQAANATVGNDNKINGDNGTVLDGGLYFPVGDLDILGNTGQVTQCVMIVAWTVTFSGNAEVQNDVTDCEAESTVDAAKVRLIA